MLEFSKTTQDWTTQESASPYIKAVEVSANTKVDPSKAIHMNGTSAEVTLTIGEKAIGVYLIQGRTYKISATMSNSADVVFLY